MEALIPKPALTAKVREAPKEKAKAAKYGSRIRLALGCALQSGLVVVW